MSFCNNTRRCNLLAALPIEAVLERCFQNALEAYNHGMSFEETFRANLRHELTKVKWRTVDISWFVSSFRFAKTGD
jgi:hypothetical protein